MSRIGKQPVKLADGLTANLEGNKLVIKKGQDSKEIDTKGVVKVNIEGDTLTFEPIENTKFAKAMWGTVRALANNAVIGLTKGFEKKLEINGVGYRAAVKGSDKQQVGQVAAEIRAFRKPEPYKGKGVKYVDEHIIRKAGKTAKK
jgi:large subunit ribosomal protein L6